MIRPDLRAFLEEDLGVWDDSTTILPDIRITAIIMAKEDCVVSGLEEAESIFNYLGAIPRSLFDDGEDISAMSEVMYIEGDAGSILRGERLALNILGRMSGISTLTRECVIHASGVKIACTRKTTPGFRFYEKKAVVLGGGDPHRFDLSGSVMIKDNHIAIMGIQAALEEARRRASFTKKIEVEVESLEQFITAARLGADIILLDNMAPEQIQEGVKALQDAGLREGVLLEASGGISPEVLAEYAGTGVDVISMGCLTKNARWIDFSLEICGQGDA